MTALSINCDGLDLVQGRSNKNRETDDNGWVESSVAHDTESDKRKELICEIFVLN